MQHAESTPLSAEFSQLMHMQMQRSSEGVTVRQQEKGMLSGSAGRRQEELAVRWSTSLWRTTNKRCPTFTGESRNSDPETHREVDQLVAGGLVVEEAHLPWVVPPLAVPDDGAVAGAPLHVPL